MSRPDRATRSRRRGARARAATKVTIVTRTRVTVAMRFAYSMKGWICQEPLIRWRKQVGQSGHPRPEPVRRTAAPVRTMTIIETKEARANQRKAGGVRRRAAGTHVA